MMRCSCFILGEVWGASLAVQWLLLSMSDSRGMGFIPGQGIRIPHTRWCSQKTRSKQVLKKKKNRGDFCNPEEKENKVRQAPRESKRE